MQPELHDQVVEHCKNSDIPMTVFIREAIRTALTPKPARFSLSAYAQDVLDHRATVPGDGV
jgi:hypothetical protein